MSRTYHHSRNWGRKSRYADPVKHGVYRCGWYGCSNRDVSESPNGFSHASDIVPYRRRDNRLLKKFITDPDLWDYNVMPYTGTRRPHEWSW